MSTTLPADSIIRKKPGAKDSNGKRINTRCVVPENSTSEHIEFVGVTCRHDEIIGDSGTEIPVLKIGDVLALVKGPVVFQDAVGMVPGMNYLTKDAEQSMMVGTALEAIAETTEQGVLIKIRLGASAAGQAAVDPRWC